MKTKSLIAALFLAASSAFAQVPSYLPTNGLVGWWPFNGNANDGTGNNNNGTINGATLTTDRFGIPNCAYDFNGLTNFIQVSTTNFPNKNRTISAWIYFNGAKNNGTPPYDWQTILDYGSITKGLLIGANLYKGKLMYNYGTNNQPMSNDSVHIHQWSHVVMTLDSTGTCSFYINNIYKNGGTITNFANTILNGVGTIGKSTNNAWYFYGKLDDIRIYNRVLSVNEISELYNESLCYQSITVTDTLIINANLTGYNPIIYNNTIKIYPNPTKDHIYIKSENNSNGYQIKIINTLSQIVYQTTISQNQYYVDLNTWSGNGTYFVQLFDTNGNLLEVRKIVIQ